MGNNGCGISRFLTLAARERTARLLKKVSASNPERYQIIRRSFRVLNLLICESDYGYIRRIRFQRIPPPD
jgi:hypothetical protein